MNSMGLLMAFLASTFLIGCDGGGGAKATPEQRAAAILASFEKAWDTENGDRLYDSLMAIRDVCNDQYFKTDISEGVERKPPKNEYDEKTCLAFGEQICDYRPFNLGTAPECLDKPLSEKQQNRLSQKMVKIMFRSEKFLKAMEDGDFQTDPGDSDSE